MSRNSSGDYTLPPLNPVAPNTTIQTAWANNTLSDIATALTESLDRGGRGGMTGQFKATNGSLGAPGISFVSDTNTGLVRLAEDRVAVVAGGIIQNIFHAAVEPWSGWSPLQFGAVGDGVTSDDAAFATMLAAMQTAWAANGSLSQGLMMRVNLCGKRYALKNRFRLTAVAGVIICNGVLVAIAGGDLSSTVPMLDTNNVATNCVFQDLILDCGKIAAGISIQASGCRVKHCIIYHMQGWGAQFAQRGDQEINDCIITQWLPGDAEFAVDANYTADGIRVSTGDCIVRGVIVRWCGPCVHYYDGAGANVIYDSHLYNGGNGVLLRDRPKLIVHEDGAGSLRVYDTYLDNGESDTYNNFVSFDGCYLLHNPTRATLEYAIAVYPTGAEVAPYGFRARNWAVVDDSFTSGDLPIVAFPDNGAFSWSGGYTGFEQIGGQNKEVIDDLIILKPQPTSSPGVLLMSAGSDANSGGIGFADRNTPLTDLTEVPRIIPNDDGAFFDKHLRRQDGWNTADGDLTLTMAYCGQTIPVSGNGAINILIPGTMRSGFTCRIVRLSALSTITFITDASGTLEVPPAATAPYIISVDRGRVDIEVMFRTSTDNARILLSGDVS